MPYYKIKRAASGAKATAWGWFAKYIKLRDALRTTGVAEHCICITCGKMCETNKMDAGHMLGRRTAGILFDESMVFAQCRKCNRDHGGEYQAYKMVMVERNGLEWYESKERAQKQNTKLGEAGLKLISDTYRLRYKALLRD